MYECDAICITRMNVELAGTGIRRMREAMITAGLQSPKIRQTTFFNISFKRPATDTAPDMPATAAAKQSPGQIKALGERLGEKLGEKLGENERKIISAIGNNQFVTISELSVMLKISTTAIENNLSRLKQKGILNRIGSAKGGHWEVVDG